MAIGSANYTYFRDTFDNIISGGNKIFVRDSKTGFSTTSISQAGTATLAFSQISSIGTSTWTQLVAYAGVDTGGGRADTSGGSWQFKPLGKYKTAKFSKTSETVEEDGESGGDIYINREWTFEGELYQNTINDEEKLEAIRDEDVDILCYNDEANKFTIIKNIKIDAEVDESFESGGTKSIKFSGKRKVKDINSIRYVATAPV